MGEGRRGKAGSVQIGPQIRRKLELFKPVFDTVLEADVPWGEYVDTVLALGIDRMLRDSVPQGKEWETIKGLLDRNPKVLLSYVAECWQTGKQQKKGGGSELLEDIERVRSYIS